ncbi:hypothetical protein CBOM_05109 [Ceraceosorus bombacis]|uniref:Uncharacterized protein n=1 Tax=Ceraceosorus bombacis TaxID=401625 RepID=A0A0P1BIJ8_9BASI|nr:hypothetical protein CBOM_05109 [Ceraceosorus bombacis]
MPRIICPAFLFVSLILGAIISQSQAVIIWKVTSQPQSFPPDSQRQIFEANCGKTAAGFGDHDPVNTYFRLQGDTTLLAMCGSKSTDADYGAATITALAVWFAAFRGGMGVTAIRNMMGLSGVHSRRGKFSWLASMGSYQEMLALKDQAKGTGLAPQFLNLAFLNGPAYPKLHTHWPVLQDVTG